MELLFATANRHKSEEVQSILGPSFTIIMPAALGLLEEIPETGTTLEANALEKAQYVWDRFHRPCFADDTGLEVDALHGEPGVYSARYAGIPSNPEKNTQKLLNLLQGEPDRSARFRCVIALILDGRSYLFEGRVEGRITDAPRGAKGFGYDPVFAPEGYSGTFAELGELLKNRISHRAHAMEALKAFLNAL